MTSRESTHQHPVTRIQGLISELKDATHSDDFESKHIHDMLDELEFLLVMIATIHNSADAAYKVARYDLITAIVSAPDPNGPKEKPDADTDEASGRGHPDR